MVQLTMLTKQMLTDTIDTVQIAILKASILALEQQMQTLLDYNKNVLNLALNTRILNADNENHDNNNVATTKLIEQNEQIVNDIYLSTIAKGIYNFTIAQSGSLLSIGQQCPMLGGNAVYKARGMYAMINDTIRYDDVNTCLQNGVILREQYHSYTNSTASSVFIVPNPAKQNATLYYQLPENAKGKMLMFDIVGKNQITKELNKNSSQIDIDVSNLSDGIYFYKVLTDGFEIGNGKLAVIK